jgi:hypothetical protein
MHQLNFSSLGYGTPHYQAPSAEIVDLKDTVPCEPLIPASVDTCAAISCLQHEPDSPPVLQVPAPYSVLCCTIGPLKVDADISVLRQSKGLWWVRSRFQGDGL